MSRGGLFSPLTPERGQVQVLYLAVLEQDLFANGVLHSSTLKLTVEIVSHYCPITVVEIQEATCLSA